MHILAFWSSRHRSDQGVREGVRCKAAGTQWLFYELVLPPDLSMSIGSMLFFRRLSFLCFGTAIVGSLLYAA